MLTSLKSFCLEQGNVKKSKKMMKIVNIDEENSSHLSNDLRNSIKFSGKMCLMIILKVTKKQGFSPSLGKTVLEKPQRVQYFSNIMYLLLF